MAKDNDLLSPNDIVSIPLSDGFTYSDFNAENEIDHGFWINDLYFEVPPERISSQEENAYAEFQALRSNSSWKIPTGIASEIITVSLSIPHKSAIKNIDSRSVNIYGDNTGKRGGVLDLILQFKHIPFSCIENAYLRSKLKIPPTHNMVFCMHNLALSTSPGEPNALVGTLTLSLMGYTPYSDKWLFKREWKSNTGLYFEDVNDVNLPGRISYKELDLRNMDFSGNYLLPASQNSDILSRLANSPGGRAFLTFGLGDDPFYTVNTKVLAPGAAGATYPNSVVNPMFQTVESLNNIDLNYMKPFEVTRHARESEPFKVYMDWLHKQMQRKVINNDDSDNTFDFTAISPYGSEDHNLGGAVILKWKEFKNIQIDPVIADKIRLHIKRKVALYRYDLFKNKRSALANIEAFEEDVNLYEGGTGGPPPGSGTPVPPGGQNLDMPNANGANDGQLHPVFATRINRWYKEAVALGYQVQLHSAYRSIQRQTELYEEARIKQGKKPGEKVVGVGRPGYSAHQFGLAIDIKAQGPGVNIYTLSVANDSKNTYDEKWSLLLEKYGLWQALRAELKLGFSEAWHIEPIETKGKTRGPTTLGPLTTSLADTIIPGVSPEAAKKLEEQKAKDAKALEGKKKDWITYRKTQLGVVFSADGQTIISDNGEWITAKTPTISLKTSPDRFNFYLKRALNTDLEYGLRVKDPAAPPAPLPPPSPPPSGPYTSPAADEFAEKLIKERVGKLPRSVTNGEVKAFAKYNAQVKAMKDDGWQMYERDLTSFDMFYKEHYLSIVADEGSVSPSPIVCDFISATAFNLFKKIPMQGLIVPSAQFLGRQDNSYILSFKGNGLNSIKKLEIIKDTLKKQGIMYKYIPESYVLRVENRFMNSLGDIYFVINGLESSTLPEQPGTYAMEMRLTGHDLYIKDQRIKRVSTVSNVETIESFVKEFVAAKTFKDIPTLEEFNTRADLKTRVFIQGTAGSSELQTYNNPGGLSAGHISFLNEVVSTINLCNKLIIPDDYEYAHKNYKGRRPTNKKIIDLFGPVLASSLGKDEPYIWLRQYEDTAQFKYPPQGSQIWRSFYYDAPPGLNYIAKPIWDFVLESEHQDYDLSDGPLRSSAFSTTDGANVLPYAKALIAWGGQTGTIMAPYIAAHRNAMAIARNTFLYWHAKTILNKPRFQFESTAIAEAHDKVFGVWETRKAMHSGSNNLSPLRNIIRPWNENVPNMEVGFDVRTSIQNGGELTVNAVVSSTAVTALPIGIKDSIFNGGTYGISTPGYEEYKYFSDLKGANKKNYADVDWVLLEGMEDGQNIANRAKKIIGANPQFISLPDNGFMDYVWNYLIIPYLNNVLRYSDIYLLVTETPYFPKTRALIIGKEQEAIGPTYEDLLLPFHPYWNENKSNIARGPSFTEPDFYLANPGTDSFAEENASRRIETNKANLTPAQAYNYYVQLCAEYATGDIDGLQTTKIPLNPQYQLGKTERPNDKQINSVQFDHHRTYTGPKTVIRKQGSTLEDMAINPQSQQVEWKDVKLLFGDNIDLVAPLNANVSDDNKLLNNRLLNWQFQDYDMYGGQDAVLRVRQGYDIMNKAGANTPSQTINPTLPVFQFHDDYNIGNGDSSPYMNFSNTRYPMLTKIKDAIGSINRKKLAARRAYPTVKIYFIEEDDIYNKEYIELDEVYSYSQVESVEITESRKRAASVCRITFLDPHGILSGFNQFAKAADPIMMSTQMQGASPGSGALNTEVTSPFLRDTKYEQSDVSFRLNVGLKIKVCMGFSNDANKLQEVFLGEISDVALDGSGNRIDIIATGYGAELVAKTKGISEAEAQITYNDTFDLLAHLMFEPEIIHFGRKKFNSVTMFGEDQSIKANSIQYKETFAIGGMINANKPGGFPGYSWLSGFGTSEWKAEAGAAFDRIFSDAAKIIAIEPYEGPQDDNLFAPNYLPIEGYYFFDYFKRWTGKISADGDYRIVRTNASGVEERDAADYALALGIPVSGILSVAGGIGAAAVAFNFMVGLAALGTLATIGVGAIAVGLGVLATYVLFVAFVGATAAVGAAIESIKTWWTGDDKLAKLDNAQLVQIVDPEALKYNIFYSTIWDVFEEMTYRHPGYVKHPRIYYKSNRMTMFFGLPDQNMWESAGDPIDKFYANKIFKELASEAEKKYRETYKVGEALINGRRDLRDVRYNSSLNKSSATENRTDQIFGYDKNTISGVEMNEAGQGGKVYVDSKKLSEFLRYAKRRFKPFRKWHNVNSYTDIISNDIEATADGWYTEVQVQYTTTPKWGADSKAEDAAEDVKSGETTPGNANALVDWDADKVVTKQANVDLQPQYVRSTSYQFVNAKSIGLAKTYARAILAKQAKEMYKGSLTIMGNPYIRPYDVIMLSDTYSNMYGPIEVEEVNHIFSPETGYVTVIYPDTFIVQEDTTPYVIMNGINHDVHTRTEYYMENSLAAFPKWGDLQNYSSQGRAYMADMSKVINAYRRSVEEQELDIEKISHLFFGRSRNKDDDFALGGGNGIAGEGNFGAVPTAAAIAGTTAVVGVGHAALTGLGFTAGELISTGYLGGTIIGGGTASGIVGATLVTGGLALGAIAIGALAAGMFYFYASSRISQMILNYIADSRAFIMIPLVREGQPMIAGINFGYASGMHKSPMQYIRQYWMDGGMGRSLQESDMLMRHASIANRNGGKIDSFLARTELGVEAFSFNFDNVFADIGDYMFQDMLFPEGGSDGAAAELVNTVGKGVVP